MRQTFLALALSVGASTTAMAGPTITNSLFAFTGPAAGGQIGYNATVTGWSSPATFSGFPGDFADNFVFGPAGGASGSTIDNGGVTGQFGNLTMYPTATPALAGGNWVAVDGGGPVTGPFETTITGLTPGDLEVITFDVAYAQQNNRTGNTSDTLTVSLTGASGSSSGSVSGFDPAGSWTSGGVVSVSLLATDTTEVLSFLNVGAPTGAPPFVAISDPTLTQIPEPATTGLFAMAIATITLIGLRRRA